MARRRYARRSRVRRTRATNTRRRAPARRARTTRRRRSYRSPNSGSINRKTVQIGTITAPALSATSTSYNWTLSTSPISTFGNSFLYYRIRKIVFKIQPTVGSVSGQDVYLNNWTYNNGYWTAIYRGTSSPPTTESAMQAYPGARRKPYFGTGNATIRAWTPNVLQSNLYDGSGGLEEFSQIRYSPWIATANSDVFHYGLAFVLDPVSPNAGQTLVFKWTATVYWEFKKPYSG